jgi:hypothetical protein
VSKERRGDAPGRCQQQTKTSAIVAFVWSNTLLLISTNKSLFNIRIASIHHGAPCIYASRPLGLGGVDKGMFATGKDRITKETSDFVCAEGTKRTLRSLVALAGDFGTEVHAIRDHLLYLALISNDTFSPFVVMDRHSPSRLHSLPPEASM